MACTPEEMVTELALERPHVFTCKEGQNKPFDGIPRLLTEAEILPERSRSIVEMRRRGILLKQIAASHGLSVERVRQILLRCQRKYLEHLRAHASRATVRSRR